MNCKDPVIRCSTLEPHLLEPDITEEEKREQERLYYKQVREEKKARGKK